MLLSCFNNVKKLLKVLREGKISYDDTLVLSLKPK